MKHTLLTLAALLPLAATAAEFNAVQLEKSQIAFVSKQMGVPVEGRLEPPRKSPSIRPSPKRAAPRSRSTSPASMPAAAKPTTK
jgi:hypothetical protein